MKYVLPASIFVMTAGLVFALTVRADSHNNDPDVVAQENTTVIEQFAEAGSESVTNVNQSNTVIHESQPTPTPEPVIPNENLQVTITDNLDTVRPGQAMSYRITLRNHIHQDLNNILVRMQVPPYFIPDTTEPEANTTDPQRRVIEWKQQQISAGSEVSFTLNGQAEPGSPNQAELIAQVLVNGPGIRQNAQDKTVIISGAIAGTSTTTPSGQTITVAEPAAVDVRPTAPTGATGSLAIGSLLSVAVGFWSTRRLIAPLPTK